MEAIKSFFDKYFRVSTMSFSWNDLLEIIIFAVIIYNVILWIKKSRAWMLLKGAVTIVGIYVLASVLQLNNILFIFHYITTYVVIGAIVILQPEIRKALEQLGTKFYLSDWLPLGDTKEKEEQFSADTAEAIVKASYTLGRSRTGALIVIERNVALDDYVKTGIGLNADISVQLLEQIFEHNTPLHDGAIIIKGNKILAATCYLPLSENMSISKELGTRHRAGLGISEVSDSLTVIVSEETGGVTLAKDGTLYRNLDKETLRAMLNMEQGRKGERRRIINWKGKQKDEE